ncbi:leucyl aminopeptidase [Arsenophonus symbiont of Ornithomya chloropus]|uniref:leucyl aminopeptidase n=1 Tax=Arsenophonus symbiont of Ornithomya chloropus TaxID=634121 RepID=UPI003D6D2B35
MNFSITSHNTVKNNIDCIVLGVFESYQLSNIAHKFNNISDKYISTLIEREKLEGKIGQILLLHHVPHISYERVLLVGCGKINDINELEYKKIIEKTISALNKTGTKKAILFLVDLHIRNKNTYWKIRKAVEIIKDTIYKFDQFKKNKTPLEHVLSEIVFYISKNHDLTDGELALKHGLALAMGIESAKNLANMPPNICNPSYLTDQAYKLSNTCKNLSIQIIDEKEMQNLSMNAYLAVGKGAKNKSFMSIIKYNGSEDINKKYIVLIGKGLTFDSGGISIKSSDRMDEMKYDMAGAATVYGIMRFVSLLRLPINVIGVLACSENMLSGEAYRPGDILTSMSGKTIEVINTDAEGRLVLCDTLTYVERFDPDVVIDVATLTGACVIALGHYYNGLMSNDDLLADELLNAAKKSGDKTWRLPLSSEFFKQLESNFADLANAGNRAGGAITAGCFLECFATKYRWAHLDIAGTAWKSGKRKGATGRPVALLAQFLLNRIYN